jgi:hypothetical protein
MVVRTLRRYRCEFPSQAEGCFLRSSGSWFKYRMGLFVEERAYKSYLSERANE